LKKDIEMDCLLDYIGLNYCGNEVVPPSGFYINDMEGVSLHNLDSLADDELDNYINVWNRVQRRTILEYKTMFMQQFNKIVRTHNKAFIEKVGAYTGKETLLTQENKYVGIRYQQYLGEYKSIKFYSINIYSEEAVTDAKFYVFNLVTNVKLYEFTTNLTEGFNTVKFEYEYFEDFERQTDIFICYDSNQIQSKKTAFTYNSDLDLLYYNIDWYNICILPAKCEKTVVNVNTIEQGQGTYGMVVNFKINCSMDAFICSVKENLIHSLALLLLSNLYKEQKHSERLNLFTIEFTSEQIDKLISDSKLESEKSLLSYFDNICIPCDDCFENNAIVHSVWRQI
jgi:hypothetical protein